jgi:hypothetical protein
MASSVRVFVHTGRHGLEEAADYYAEFPWEPSPAGELILDKSQIVKVNDATLDGVLEEMARVTAGDVVMLVCHAYGEGLLMPLAKGARLPAGQTAIARLLEVSAAQRKAKVIRAMPGGTDKEKKAKIAAWIKFTEEIAAGSIFGEVTLKEIEGLFEQWLDEVAKNELLLGGTSPRTTLNRLLEKMEKVQSLKLDRVELRACNIGDSPAGMKAVKRLFGCNKLLAPTVGTFYLKGVPVNTLQDFDQRYVREHRSGTARAPGPIGLSRTDPDDFVIEVVKKNPGTRLFWHFESVPTDPHAHMSLVRMWHIFAVTIEEIRPYWFRASAGTWKQTDKHRPDWSQARDFVNTYMMANSHYTSGPLRLAGFWTPDESVPWLLPMEPEYLQHIKQL